MQRRSHRDVKLGGMDVGCEALWEIGVTVYYRKKCPVSCEEDEGSYDGEIGGSEKCALEEMVRIVEL
jgi:hypothetical protein